MPNLIFDLVTCTPSSVSYPCTASHVASCNSWALLLCYTQSSNSCDNISWLKYWYDAPLFHSRSSLSLCSFSGKLYRIFHGRDPLWNTSSVSLTHLSFPQPFYALALIGFKTCWAGRICRQKCLKNYIGSIVSIWWTLCGSPGKSSYPSVFSGYKRRDWSLRNIGALDSSRSGYEMKQNFHHAVVNK